MIRSLISLGYVVGGLLGNPGEGQWVATLFMSHLLALFTPILLERTLLGKCQHLQYGQGEDVFCSAEGLGSAANCADLGKDVDILWTRHVGMASESNRAESREICHYDAFSDHFLQIHVGVLLHEF